MKRSIFASNQSGALNILLVPLMAATVMLIIALGFGAWAYSGRSDYKNNVEAKIEAAVKVARADEAVLKDKEFAEADKQPYKTYKGPDQYGGVSVTYPRTWSGYVVQDQSGVPLNAYFHPHVVPGINDKTAAYALRVQVIDQPYTTVVAKYNNDVKTGKVTAKPFAFVNVPKSVGVRFDGTFGGNRNLKGSVVLIPVRDKTLQISTEGTVYQGDFDNAVLPNITFSP